MQKSFQSTHGQRMEMELSLDEPSSNRSARGPNSQQADLLRHEGFSADVPEQEQQVTRAGRYSAVHMLAE